MPTSRWAEAVLPPTGPQVWLGFADGTQHVIDPWSRDGRALIAVATSLTRQRG